MKKLLPFVLIFFAHSLFTQEHGETYFAYKEVMALVVENPTPVLSVQQEKLENVSIYPNPVTTYFKIGYPSSIGDLDVEVYNILGKKVIAQNITPENNTVSASTLSKGVYMIRISSKKGVKIFKIVKQ